MSLAVLIPCLNEEATVASVIGEARSVFPRADIFVLDNGSSDRTVEFAREADAKIIHIPERGKGRAIAQAVAGLDYESFLVVDGDNTYPLNRAAEMHELVTQGKADMVIGNRLSRENSGAFAVLNIAGNFLISFLIRVLFRSQIRDVLSGMRLIHRRYLNGIEIQSTGFEVETELTIKGLSGGKRIHEVPIGYRSRPAGSQPKLNPVLDGWKILSLIVKMRLSALGRSGIFTPREELLHLVTPLLFVPLILAELALGFNLPWSIRIFTINFIEVVLGSAGHNGLSWVIVFFMPEGRLWLRDNGGRKFAARIFLTAALVFTSISALLFLPAGNTIFKLFLLVDWFLILHHALTQTRGIGFFYTFKNREEDRSAAATVHGRQKLAFILLAVVATVPGLYYVLDIEWILRPGIREAWALTALALSSWIVFSNLKFKEDQSNKVLFLSRILFLPLTFYSFFAAMSVRVMHAMEFVFIYRQMASRSRKNLTAPGRKLTWIAAGFYCAAIFLWTFSIRNGEGIQYFFPVGDELPAWLKIMSALSFTRLYMHYFLDRQIFRMRTPASSKWIGRLVGPQSSRHKI